MDVFLQLLLTKASLMLRYGVSGVAGIVANLIVFSVAVILFGMWYMYATLIGFLAAYVTTFTLHKYWTFEQQNKDTLLAQSLLYLTSALGVLVVNMVLLYCLVQFFSIASVLAQGISVCISAGVSFLFTSRVTFNKNEHRLQILNEMLLRGWRSATAHFPFVALLVVMALGVSFVRIYYMPLSYTTDAIGYVATADFLLEKPEAVFYGERLIKPLAPAVIALLSFLGMSTVDALLFQAVFLYVVLGITSYAFGWVLFRDKTQAFLTSFFVLFSYPMVRYGLDYYTETGAWALYFASLAGIVLWYQRPLPRILWFVALTILLGILWKEYSFLVGLALGLVILFHAGLSLKSKAYAILQCIFVIVIPWLLWQYYVYTSFGYTYVDWLIIGTNPDAYHSEYSLLSVGKSLFVLLLGYWLFVVYGLMQWRTIPTLVKSYTYFLLVPSCGFLLWGYVSSRLFFSLVPLVVPLAVVGVVAITHKRLRWLLVVGLGVFHAMLLYISFGSNMRAIINYITYGS